MPARHLMSGRRWRSRAPVPSSPTSNPGTDYAYQVVGIVDEESYPSAVAVLQTEEAMPEVTHVSVAPQQTTAQVSWEGYGHSFNVRYAVDMATDNTAKVTLTAGDVWEDLYGTCQKSAY